VVAPTSVCHNWSAEIERFAPSLNVHVLREAQDRGARVETLRPLDVLITSYGLLAQEEDLLSKTKWQMAVFDEAQAFKNAETRRAQAARKIEADFRLALTGTPIENDLDELWSLFNTINPHLLGSRERFQSRFAAPIERQKDMRVLGSLRSLVRPFMLRRTKSMVLSELPPRTEVTIEVELPPDERAFYEALRQNALETLSKLSGPGGEKGAQRIHILAEITKLRRALCHPSLVDPGSLLPGAKLATFLELSDELLRNRHKALVFSQFTGQLEQVAKALDSRGISYQYLDGSTPPKEREKRVEAFQSGQGDLFLISLRAGGTGLNLTAADYVIHLDPWWNPAVEDQASDRAHRIGQQRPVTIYRLIATQSIEEKILDLHKRKRDLASDLLEGAEMTGKLTNEDLIGLIEGG
jgi:SNF2 family DNA or RNA helicase